MKKVLGTFVLVGMLVFLLSGQFSPFSAESELNIQAKSAILIDANTGEVIFEMNADEAMPPASMSKMMTEYIVLDAIESGQIHWDNPVFTSQYASEVLGSQINLQLGEELKVKDMFAAVAIHSANDAAVALAEHIAGSEGAFVDLMNQKAKALSLSAQAQFINASGLSRYDLGDYANELIEGETLITARDSAMIAYHLLKDHPQILEVTGHLTYLIEGRGEGAIVNTNRMLDANQDELSYYGMDGLKTGYTDEAGYCFTGTVEQDGRRLISVVMGAADETARFQETKKLLDYGFKVM